MMALRLSFVIAAVGVLASCGPQHPDATPLPTQAALASSPTLVNATVAPTVAPTVALTAAPTGSTITPSPATTTPRLPNCALVTQEVLRTFGLDIRLSVSPAVVHDGEAVTVQGNGFIPGHYRLLLGPPVSDAVPSGEVDVGQSGELLYTFPARWPFDSPRCLGIFARIGDGPIASTPLFLYLR
jgi:hypothetical protein